MKYTEWYDTLNPQTKEYLSKQPIWHDRDLYKATGVGIAIGFVVGLVVGFEWAWRPVVANCIRYVTG